MSTEILMPFSLSANGQIAATSDPNQQIRQHVLSLVNTEPGERTMLSTYGVPLNESLFENADSMLLGRLNEEIKQAFSTWEPGIVANGLTVGGDLSVGQVTIDVKYARTDAPNTGVGGSKTNVAIIQVGGHVDEVVTA